MGVVESVELAQMKADTKSIQVALSNVPIQSRPRLNDLELIAKYLEAANPAFRFEYERCRRQGVVIYSRTIKNWSAHMKTTASGLEVTECPWSSVTRESEHGEFPSSGFRRTYIVRDHQVLGLMLWDSLVDFTHETDYDFQARYVLGYPESVGGR